MENKEWDKLGGHNRGAVLRRRPTTTTDDDDEPETTARPLSIPL